MLARHLSNAYAGETGLIKHCSRFRWREIALVPPGLAPGEVCDKQRAALFEHSSHLAQGRLRVGYLVKGMGADHGIEVAVRELVHVLSVRLLASGSSLAAISLGVQVFMDEIGPQVNADGLLRKLAGQETDHVAIAAADVEDSVKLPERLQDLGSYLLLLDGHRNSPITGDD